MRQLFTITRAHGSDGWSVALSPSDPVREHRKLVKEMRVAKSHPTIAEVRLCVPIRRVTVDPASPQPGKGASAARATKTTKKAPAAKAAPRTLFGSRI